jgi:hypothetical protein
VVSCNSSAWLRCLVAGLSQRRPSFVHGSIHVGFVVGKVGLGQVFLRVVRFPLSISFHRRSLCSRLTWGMNTSLLVAAIQRHLLTLPTWATISVLHQNSTRVNSFHYCYMTNLNITSIRMFFPWRWGGSSTLAWMPTYVSILRIPQMVWVWRATVEWYWQGTTEELGEKPFPVPLCPPQIPHGLTWARTRASAVTGRRLTAWAMARPIRMLQITPPHVIFPSPDINYVKDLKAYKAHLWPKCCAIQPYSISCRTGQDTFSCGSIHLLITW